MKKIILLLFLLFFSRIGNAQSKPSTYNFDSLWHVWNDKTLADTLRSGALELYAWEKFMYKTTDSTIYYAHILQNFLSDKGRDDLLADAVYMEATAYYLKGMGTEARKFFLKSLEFYTKANEKPNISRALGSIALTYQHEGNYATAIEYHEKALAIAEELNDSIALASSNNNIGQMYLKQGDYSKALEHYMISLKIKEKLGDSLSTAGTINNLSVFYQETGNADLALSYALRSLEINRAIKNNRGISRSLNNVGNAYGMSKQNTKALDYYFQSLTIKEKTGDKQGVASSLINIGYNYNLQHKYTPALEYYTKSYTLAKSINASGELIHALQGMIFSNMMLGNTNESIKNLSALKNLRQRDLQTNFFSFSEHEKELYFSTMENDFGLYYDFTVFNQTNFPELKDTALNLALQNKSLTLKSSIAMRNSILNGTDTVLINDYEKWIVLKNKISTSYAKGQDTKEMENQANTLEKEIVKRSAVFADFDKIKNLDWKQVRNNLKEDECAIEFVNFESKIDTLNPVMYAAFILKPGNQHPDLITICNEKDLEQILGSLQSNNLNFVNKVYGTQTNAQQALYEKIWSPLEPYLKNIKTVYYAPSGLLNKISFAAIAKDKNIFLCDTYKFHQVNSTGKLALPNETTFTGKESMFLAGGINYSGNTTKKEIWPYLPGSKNETDVIYASRIKQKQDVTYYKESEATEENVKAKTSDAGILHIATHGFFFPDPEKITEEKNKTNDVKQADVEFRGTGNYADLSFVKNKNALMRSGIVLANANNVWDREAKDKGEDGVLTAAEVSNLNLRKTKLVVLSACETGLGDIKGSEGVYGLQRAFKMAGVQFLIMSLWQVPDKETAEFMQLFYTNLNKTKNVPAAFTQTQKTLRKKYDPYYWAAFILIE